MLKLMSLNKSPKIIYTVLYNHYNEPNFDGKLITNT